MNNEMLNAERYLDLTAYEAIRNTEREKAAAKAADFRTSDAYRPLVYVCSPFAGDVENNTVNARRYSRFALERMAIPMTPHLLYPQFMDDNDPAERHLACHKINYVLIGLCAEIWVFGSRISKGMEFEIRTARKRNMTIRYFTEGLEEVTKDA